MLPIRVPAQLEALPLAACSSGEDSASAPLRERRGSRCRTQIRAPDLERYQRPWNDASLGVEPAPTPDGQDPAIYSVRSDPPLFSPRRSIRDEAASCLDILGSARHPMGRVFYGMNSVRSHLLSLYRALGLWRNTATRLLTSMWWRGKAVARPARGERRLTRRLDQGFRGS